MTTKQLKTVAIATEVSVVASIVRELGDYEVVGKRRLMKCVLGGGGAGAGGGAMG